MQKIQFWKFEFEWGVCQEYYYRLVKIGGPEVWGKD